MAGHAGSAGAVLDPPVLAVPPAWGVVVAAVGVADVAVRVPHVAADGGASELYDNHAEKIDG